MKRIKIDRLDPAEEFLKYSKVRDSFQLERMPDTIHLFEVTDNGTVILFPEFLVQNYRQNFVRSVDPFLVWINILILISIVFVPFSTNVAGTILSFFKAAVIFHANRIIVGFLFILQWHHIRLNEHLCKPVPEKAAVRHGFYHSLPVPSVAATGGLISLVNPPISLLVYFPFRQECAC